MITTIRQARRPVAFVLLGCVLGAALIAPVAAHVVKPASRLAAVVTYTRAVSCDGFDFHATDSTAVTGVGLGALFNYGLSPLPILVTCDPGIPNKATVTRIRFTLNDISSTEQASDCALVRYPLAVGDFPYTILASVPATGVAFEGGPVRLTSSSIGHAKIDMSNYAYFLQCHLGTEVGIVGADILYTISSTNG